MVKDIRGDMGVVVLIVVEGSWIEGADVSWGGVVVGGNVRNNKELFVVGQRVLRIMG